MHIRTVPKIDLESERCDTAAVSSLAMKDIDSADSRAAYDRSRRDRNRHYVERVLQRDPLGRAERSSITKRGDEELSIFRFVMVQAAEDRRCFRREAGPEAKLVVAAFQEKRIIACLCECRRVDEECDSEGKDQFSRFHSGWWSLLGLF